MVVSEDLYAALCGALALIVAPWALWAVHGRLGKRREELAVAFPVALGFAIRVLVMAILSASPTLSDLRGPDDAGFLTQAFDLSTGDAFTQAISGRLHVTVLAAEVAILGEQPEFALRSLQILIAMTGVCLLAAAAYDLAGARAARVVAWVLALEPANVFFSGLVLKEPLMLVAEGIVALGAVRMWRRRDAKAFALLATGAVVATGMRPYIGVALAAGATLLTLHAALRPMGSQQRRALPLAAVIVMLGLAGLVVVSLSTSQLLSRLQAYQTANTSDRSNLGLEPVDFSTPRDLAVNLPRRIRDLLFRPYPWQVTNLSQRSGAVGTLAAWLVGLGLLAAVIANPRRALQRGPPVAYILAAVLLAYAVTTGNAGTGFRYRTHVVALTVVLAAILMPLSVGRRGPREPASKPVGDG